MECHIKKYCRDVDGRVRDLFEWFYGEQRNILGRKLERRGWVRKYGKDCSIFVPGPSLERE